MIVPVLYCCKDYFSTLNKKQTFCIPSIVVRYAVFGGIGKLVPSPYQISDLQRVARDQFRRVNYNRVRQTR